MSLTQLVPALPLPTLLSTALLLLVLHSISPFLLLLLRQRLSPLRHLPGPPSPSFFLGNLPELHDQENSRLLRDWQAKYGDNLVYKGFVGGCRLLTTDPVAIAHILGHAYEFPKPDFVRDSLASMAAGHDGLLTVEGEQHRRQRKILTPAFTASHIKSITPIFWEKAIQLRDVFHALSAPSAPSAARIDVLSWLARATLDVMGLAGFGYTFSSLPSPSSLPESESASVSESELAQAFAVIFSTARKFRVLTILQVWFPILRRFRRNNSTMRHARETMRRIGMRLIEERKALFESQSAASSPHDKPEPTEPRPPAIEGDKTTLGRDLLSVLIRSNLSTHPTSQLSLPETLSQISTFLAAGHETTSSALSWTLYALARAPRVQRKLCDELRTLPSFEEGHKEIEERTTALMALPYLDAVVRESLRCHAPITSTMRVVGRDTDVIPVSRAFIDKNGVARRGIEVKKHDIITIPISAVNKSREIWGEDAEAFRPERWHDPPPSANAIPGLYSNTLTFLNGNPLNGNRACIGYKFALTEIKIFLYVLLRDMQFSIDPATVIEKRVNVVTRPFVKNEPQLGNQMPLYVRSAPPIDRDVDVEDVLSPPSVTQARDTTLTTTTAPLDQTSPSPV